MADDIIIPTYEKAVTAVEAYSWNWAPFLGVGDTIATSTWDVPVGLTADTPSSPTHDATSTTVWLSGGTAGEVYPVVNQITTALGRVWPWSFLLRVYDPATA